MNTATQTSFTSRDAARILFRHWRKAALAFTGISLLALLAIILYPRSYASEAKLFIRVGRESVGLDPTATTGQTIMLQKTQDAEVNSALVQDLAASLPAGGLRMIHPWPDGAEFALVLTHDVETSDGLRRVPELARLEEELGYRSSWNIVPHKYPVDMGLVRDLASRGFEIGVHGYNHDGRLFASRRLFDQRAKPINAAVEQFGAVGFRAPMVHRNLQWMQSLEVEYDASCFDADPFQAMPGGVGGIWPFMAGRFVELPYTLPQDHTLFVALGERDGRIWEEKLAWLARLEGMALVITHPDYLDSPHRLDAYRRFLVNARQYAGMWSALPREAAHWWRVRDKLRIVGQTADARIEGAFAARARLSVLERSESEDAERPTVQPFRWRTQPAAALQLAGN